MKRQSTLEVFDENHPILSAFIKLCLILSAWGIGLFIGFYLLVVIMLRIKIVSDHVAIALGGSTAAKIIGILTFGVIFISSQIIVGIASGLSIAKMKGKFPDHLIFRFVRWVKKEHLKTGISYSDEDF